MGHKEHVYQLGLSEQHSETMYNTENRLQKAKKTVSVIRDYFQDTEQLSVLDIGCSTGMMTKLYSDSFSSIKAIDIDEPAVAFAIKNNTSANVEFFIKDAMNTEFEGDSFDVVICTNIYEHVPDYNLMISEIYRVLKPGGICYFAAGNRLIWMEGHYHLPLLSVIPKPLAHLYLRVLGRGNYYYENHLTYWSLKKLVSQFEIVDYTRKIIEEPEKFHATEMLLPGSFKQKAALVVLKLAYWACPSYIWLLKKAA